MKASKSKDSSNPDKNHRRIYQQNATSLPKTATITATLLKPDGTPAVGKTITASTTIGTLTPLRKVTDAPGSETNVPIPVVDVYGESSSSGVGITGQTVPLNHAANVLVLAHVYLFPATPSIPVTSMKCGGVDMELVKTQGYLRVYVLPRLTAANENVVLVHPGTYTSSLTAFSVLNAPLSPPYIECVVGVNSLNGSIAPGTAGRLVIQALGAYLPGGSNRVWTVTPGSGQTEIDKAATCVSQAGSVVEANWKGDNGAGTTMSATVDISSYGSAQKTSTHKNKTI
jgi:hypothetical protein